MNPADIIVPDEVVTASLRERLKLIHLLKYNEPMADRFSITGRIKSFAYAFKGLLRALANEHNLWVQAFIALLVIVFGFIFRLSVSEWLAVIVAIGLVIVAELINTAIEKLVDFVSPDYHRKAGQIKDTAAGAVLLAAIVAVVIGCLVFIPHIIDIL